MCYNLANVDDFLFNMGRQYGLHDLDRHKKRSG